MCGYAMIIAVDWDLKQEQKTNIVRCYGRQVVKDYTKRDGTPFGVNKHYFFRLYTHLRLIQCKSVN